MFAAGTSCSRRTKRLTFVIPVNTGDLDLLSGNVLLYKLLPLQSVPQSALSSISVSSDDYFHLSEKSKTRCYHSLAPREHLLCYWSSYCYTERLWRSGAADSGSWTAVLQGWFSPWVAQAQTPPASLELKTSLTRRSKPWASTRWDSFRKL